MANYKRGTRQKCYSSESVKNKRIIPYAWDTETNGLGGELLCITLSRAGEGETAYLSSENMISDFLTMCFENPTGFMKLSKDGKFIYPKLEDGAVIYYAHNAQYDLRYFIQHSVSNKYHIEIKMRTDADIYEIVLAKTREAGSPFITLRDSLAIFPATLQQFTDQFSPDCAKITGSIDFEGGEIFDPSNKLHIDYAKRDALSLRLALENYFQVIYDDYGVTPGATSAGTALRAWQKTLPSDMRIFGSSTKYEKFFRNGYYGGLVFLTTTETQKDAECYDINSSYPASMREYGVPFGHPMYSKKYIPSNSRPGLFFVNMSSPENLIIPIIPRRDKNQDISWASGTFDTVVTNYEIDFALSHGYKLNRTYWGTVWEKMFFPFTDFVNKAEQIRNANKKTARETVAKNMQNSVYGKFGTDRTRKEVYHPTAENPASGVPLPGIQDDLLCDAYFYVREKYSDDMLCKVEFSLFITAMSRLNLLKNAYSVGPANVFYGDTDSMTIKKGAGSKIDVGTKYGQWKLEKIWEEFHAIAPKMYAGKYSEKYIQQNIEYGGAVKGLSKKAMTQEKWKELLLDGKTNVDYNSLDSLIKTIKTGVIKKAVVLNRKSSDLKNSRHFKTAGSDVRPKKIKAA
jgi:hypothetical protein